MKHGRTAALTLITLLAGANFAVSACCVVAPAQLSNTIGFASETTWHCALWIFSPTQSWERTLEACSRGISYS